MKKTEKLLRRGIVIAGELLTGATIISIINSSDWERLLLAFGTLLFVLVPELLERLFRCRINTVLYIAAVLYALGPMMGHCWMLYYTIPFWDKLLHICGGLMFAVLGVFLFQLMSRKNAAHLPAVAFALSFSIAIAVVWEFLEYGADVFLGMNMQSDTLVREINSYLLGTEMGTTGSISPIAAVSVNGMPLSLDGYLDLGIHDTMLDMLLESLGALVTCTAIYLDNGKHSLIVSRKA